MNKLKGSCTIEASILFPLIMTVTVMMIYMAFFIHDRCVLNAAAYQAALRGSRVRTEEGKVMSVTSAAARELTGGILLAATDVSPDIVITGEEIEVSYEGIMKIPAAALLFRISGSDGIHIKVRSTAKRKDPVRFIRECRFIENMASAKE